MLKGRHTTTLKRHLESHTKEYKEYLDFNQSNSSITKFCVTSPSLHSLSSKDSAEKVILDLFSFTPIRFNIVEDEHFKNLINTLSTGMQIITPSRFKLRELFLKRVYSLEKSLRNKLINRKITISTDIWSQKNLLHSYLGLTCQFFDFEEGNIQNFAIDLVEITGSHTAVKIHDIVSNSLDNLRLKDSDIMRIITDQGANMVSAFKCKNYMIENENNSDESTENESIPLGQLKVKRISCFAHILNSSLKAIFDKKTHESSSFKKNILTFSNRINQSSQKVEFLKGISNKRLLKYSNTRWNCFYLLIQRIKDLKDDIIKVSAEFDLPINFMWQEVDKYIEILKPFQAGTDLVQNDFLSISRVLPIIIGLLEHMELMAVKFPEYSELLIELKDHFSKKTGFINDTNHQHFDEIYLLATMLDPVSSAELTDEYFKKGKSALEDFARKYYLAQSSMQQDNDHIISIDQSPVHKIIRRSFKKEKTQPQNPIDLELIQYLNLLDSGNFWNISNPIDFWKINNQMVLLSKLALEILSVPATSSSAERLFSIAGYLSSGRRASISPFLLRDRVLCLYNKKFFK